MLVDVVHDRLELFIDPINLTLDGSDLDLCRSIHGRRSFTTLGLTSSHGSTPLHQDLHVLLNLIDGLRLLLDASLEVLLNGFDFIRDSRESTLDHVVSVVDLAAPAIRLTVDAVFFAAVNWLNDVEIHLVVNSTLSRANQ